MSVVHDFSESLAASHRASDLPIWQEIYRQAFPNMVACIDHRDDGEHQRAGIDRSVILSNSKQVPSTKRSDTGTTATSCLSNLSNDRRNTPGWVCKPQRADYICYAVATTGRAYMLPVPQLQLAWAENGELWKATYRRVPAANDGYTTYSCPVPVHVLFPALGKTLRFGFTPIQEAA